MNKEILNIDISKVINCGISIESYFIIHCLYNNKKELLEKYVLKCGKIDKSIFEKLLALDFITIKDNTILFENLKLTVKAINKLGLIPNEEFEVYWKELLEIYPKKIKKNGIIVRSNLHQNLSGCKNKYRSLIDSKETHDLIIKCTKIYLKEYFDSGKEEFIQMLPTFLNQENYNGYIEDAKNTANIVDKAKDDYDII